MSQFDMIVERKKTRSVKWGMMEKVYGIEDATDILPMWVADMDFQAPKPVLNALQTRLEHGVFGYSYVCEGCKKAIVAWFSERHKWEIDPETILFHHGVIPIIASVIETFTKSEDQIGMMTPVYPPFFNLPAQQERKIVKTPLIENNGSYVIDFEALEKDFQNISLFILCNPHNPAGVVWKKEDLERIIELAVQYNVLILSDEIHADLVFEGSTHTPLLTIPNAKNAKVISAIAPTKTFNLAGIHAAMMVVPNDELREQLMKHAAAHGHGELNAFAASAIQAAYSEGGPWLDELLQYINHNMNFVKKELNALEGIKVTKPAGTYLMWIDYRDTGLSEKEMMDRLLKVGKLALEPGTKYGEEGRGFLRMNVGCPFEYVKDGVARFKKALR